MYTIDNISLTSYGLHVSNHKGQVDLPEVKEQFYTAYGFEGFQPTKRKGNELELNGFIIANDMSDFIAKCATLRTVFSAAGLRVLSLDNGNLNVFAIDGFTIDNVKVNGAVYAKFNIKLLIV